MTCLFCDIINGTQKAHKILDSSNFIAILDIFPVNKGHILLIPKIHIESIEKLPIEQSEELLHLIQQITRIQRDILSAQGINVIANNGVVAGQKIFHAHIHLIPRYKNDGLESWPGKAAEETELTHLATKLISKF
jgi:histidine triad (HIT) family protein